MRHTLVSALWLGLLGTAISGEVSPIVTTGGASGAQPGLPNLDVVRGGFTYASGMDFEDVSGELSITRFDLFSLLSRPITVAGDVMLLPVLQYGFTDFDFDDTAAGSPVGDEELHAISLHLAAVKLNEGSPWFYGAWMRGELASDFQDIGGDDFTFDVAAGVGYRFSESLTVAAGVAAINLNGDSWVVPGINFDWKVSDKIRVGLYGPMALATYTPSEDWLFSLRGNPGGGVWNISDANGDSRSVNLSSYQVGVHASRRITGKLWGHIGAGVTLGNNLEYADADGDNELLDEDMDAGWFGQIGLSLRAW